MNKIPDWLLHYSSIEMLIVGAAGGALSPYLCEWLNICRYGVIAGGGTCFAVGVIWLSVKRITVIALSRINEGKRGN
ncbi:hypothetical protein FSD44_14070 [Salmonella enterica]|nr:hypothetical protein [Salmonella enterica]